MFIEYDSKTPRQCHSNEGFVLAFAHVSVFGTMAVGFVSFAVYLGIWLMNTTAFQIPFCGYAIYCAYVLGLSLLLVGIMKPYYLWTFKDDGDFDAMMKFPLAFWVWGAIPWLIVLKVNQWLRILN